MNWNDYEAVWKRQKPPIGSTAELPALFATFESRSRKMHGVVKVRDFAEASAGVVGSCIFALLWWKLGKTAWPMAIAIALLLGVSALFIRERFRARRFRLSPEAPLLAKIENDIALLRHQRRMVKALWIWYLGPCAGSTFTVFAVLYRRQPAGSPMRDPAMVMGFGAFFALTYWFAWAINRRALRKEIEPRIEELEKMYHDLQTPK
jgi:MFS family permease